MISAMFSASLVVAAASRAETKGHGLGGSILCAEGAHGFACIELFVGETVRFSPASEFFRSFSFVMAIVFLGCLGPVLGECFFFFEGGFPGENSSSMILIVLHLTLVDRPIS